MFTTTRSTDITGIANPSSASSTLTLVPEQKNCCRRSLDCLLAPIYAIWNGFVCCLHFIYNLVTCWGMCFKREATPQQQPPRQPTRIEKLTRLFQENGVANVQTAQLMANDAHSHLMRNDAALTAATIQKNTSCLVDQRSIYIIAPSELSVRRVFEAANQHIYVWKHFTRDNQNYIGYEIARIPQPSRQPSIMDPMSDCGTCSGLENYINAFANIGIMNQQRAIDVYNENLDIESSANKLGTPIRSGFVVAKNDANNEISIFITIQDTADNRRIASQIKPNASWGWQTINGKTVYGYLFQKFTNSSTS